MTLGDLSLNIILNISDTDVKVKQLTTSLSGVDAQLSKTGATSVQLKDKLSAVGLSLQGLFSILQIGKATLGEFLQKYNEYNSALLGLNSVAAFKGIDPNAAKNTVAELELVKNGLLSVADASTTLKNLLSANFTLEQSVDILKRFGDAAAFGRQGSLTFGEAIRSASEGIKNGNSILVDNAGITKNLSVMLQEAGLSAQQMMNASSDAAVRQAIYNGIMRESQGQLGDANKLMNTSAGETAKYQKAFNDFQVSLGRLFASLSIVLTPLTNFFDYLSKAPDNVKVAAVSIMGLVAVMYLFNGSIPPTVKIFALLSSLMIAMPAPIRAVIGAVFLLIAAIIALNGQITILNISLGGAPILIGLLVTGILGLSSAFGESVNSFDGFNSKIDESKKSIEEYSGSIDKIKTDLASLQIIQQKANQSTAMTEAEQKTYEATLGRVSAQYPAILSQVDEYTGKLTLNKDALNNVIKAEKERLDLAESNRLNNQVILLASMIEKYDDIQKEIGNLKNQENSLIDVMKSASAEAESFSVAVDDTETQKRLLNIQGKIGELGLSTNDLKTKFIEAIEEAYKFGNLNSVLDKLKATLGETSQSAKFFFDIISQYTGQAVNQWDAVTSAIDRMKNSMLSVVSTEVSYPKQFDKMTRNELSKSKSDYETKLKDVTPGTEEESYFKKQIKMYDDRIKQLDGVKSTISHKKHKQEKDYVDELIKSYEKYLDIFYISEDAKDKFTTSGRSLIETYRAINEEIKTNTNLTEEQIIKLVNYRDKILDYMNESGINFKKLFTAGSDDDIEKLAQQFAKERVDWYNLYGSKDKRFKPVDETKEYLEAIKLLEEINGQHLRENDYLSFANTLREKSNSIEADNIENAKMKLDLMKQADEYLQKADRLNKDRRDFDVETSKLRISLIQNEFEQKKRTVELEYNIEMTKLSELAKFEKDNLQKDRLNERIDLLKSQKEQALKKLEEDRINDNINKFTGVVSEVQNISSILNIGANTFVAKMISGMQMVISLAESLKNILMLTGIIKSVIGIASGGASMAIPGGDNILPGNLPASGGAGFSGMLDNLKNNIRNTMMYMSSYFSIPSPVALAGVNNTFTMDVRFKDFKLKGEDIHGSAEAHKIYLNQKRERLD